MKILLFVRLYAPHVGGVEKHVREVSRVLIGMGHQVMIITEQIKGTKVHEEVDGVAVYRIPVSTSEKRKKFDIWRQLFQQRELIRDADVIHVHDVFFWYLPFRLLYPRKRVFMTFHGYEGYPIRTSAKLQRLLAARLTKGNICVGRFIEKWYGTKADCITYGAVRVPDGDGLHPKKLSAGFIGRLESLTGIVAYVDAVLMLRKYYPEFLFRVAGDGSLRKDLQETVNIVTETDGAKFLQTVQFAFVSGYLTIIEALAAKRLVIAYFDNPLKKDYLKMTPYANNIIIVSSASEIAEKVIYFMSHQDEAAQKIEEGYQWAKKQAWRHLTDQYVTLWQKQ